MHRCRVGRGVGRRGGHAREEASHAALIEETPRPVLQHRRGTWTNPASETHPEVSLAWRRKPVLRGVGCKTSHPTRPVAKSPGGAELCLLEGSDRRLLVRAAGHRHRALDLRPAQRSFVTGRGRGRSDRGKEAAERQSKPTADPCRCVSRRSRPGGRSLLRGRGSSLRF